jgi:hypothetical protein
MRRFNERKFLMIIPIVIIAVLAFGGIVMGLWNAILVQVIGVKAITFVQALGILILSKILFGGFKGRGGWRGGRGMWDQEMKEKLSKMTPEEKEKFKAEWKNKCMGRWQRQPQQNFTEGEA